MECCLAGVGWSFFGVCVVLNGCFRVVSGVKVVRWSCEVCVISTFTRRIGIIKCIHLVLIRGIGSLQLILFFSLSLISVIINVTTAQYLSGLVSKV